MSRSIRAGNLRVDLGCAKGRSAVFTESVLGQTRCAAVRAIHCNSPVRLEQGNHQGMVRTLAPVFSRVKRRSKRPAAKAGSAFSSRIQQPKEAVTKLF